MPRCGVRSPRPGEAPAPPPHSSPTPGDLHAECLPRGARARERPPSTPQGPPPRGHPRAACAALVWWVQSVYVPPEHRRKGYFKRLYALVREEARQRGAAGVRLYADDSNADAHATVRVCPTSGAVPHERRRTGAAQC